MRYATLGDIDVPVLFLGCGNFGGIGSLPELFGRGDDHESAFALMDAAREAGVRMFDTANSYGGGVSEQWIGEWLADRGARDDVLLTTKVGSPIGPDRGGLSRAYIRAQIDASLRRLRTDHVDLYLAHTTDESTPVAETVEAFAELVRAGKIRAYGLSNFGPAEVAAALAAASDVKPVNLQSGYNLLDRAESASFDVCAAAGIGFTAFSPLAGGLLTGKYRVDQAPPDGSRQALRPTTLDMGRERGFAALDRLGAAAAERGMSLANLAMAWLLNDPGVTAAVLGVRRPDQLTAMCEAAEVELTENERAELVAMVDAG